MAKWMSPARIFGRKNSFCQSVPKFMIVGPTVLSVRVATGAPARIDSSKKMNWSMGSRSWPPYSLGQPRPAQPSSHIFFQTALAAGLMLSPWNEARVSSSRSSS